jgi:hypothetical protein
MPISQKIGLCLLHTYCIWRITTSNICLAVCRCFQTICSISIVLCARLHKLLRCGRAHVSRDQSIDDLLDTTFDDEVLEVIQIMVDVTVTQDKSESNNPLDNQVKFPIQIPYISDQLHSTCEKHVTSNIKYDNSPHPSALLVNNTIDDFVMVD